MQAEMELHSPGVRVWASLERMRTYTSGPDQSTAGRHHAGSAACKACSNTSSLKGLAKHATAPAFIACTVIGMSPWPVMKMIGHARSAVA